MPELQLIDIILCDNPTTNKSWWE